MAITINGKTIIGGTHVVAINGRIIVDGEDVTEKVSKTGYLDVRTGSTKAPGVLSAIARAFKL
ncbi:peptide deformylase [Novimethylophilus kurashikiensis]|uniref:Peptide deformylase n=1 Tax=Novimethylophilus kurashikiensis TaxID=1825523 RepID=A0A2R5FA97_9PROT|nr:hypothetical protein [Novimethylophilus kurashikiensis]GBG14468.1 peptide deformylase [Novimethylophilus kurashikiensis]